MSLGHIGDHARHRARSGTIAWTTDGSDDHATAARKLFQWAEQLVGVDGAAIHMRTDRGVELTWAVETGNAPAGGRVLDEGGSGPVLRALSTATTQVVTDEDDLSAPAMRAFAWKSAICVPLVVDDCVIGVFSAGWRSRVPVSSDIRLILEAAASMSVAVLHRNGLVQDLKREQQRLRDVLEGLPVAASIIDIDGPRVRWRNRRARRLFGDVGAPGALEATFGSESPPRDGVSGRTADDYRSMLLERTPPGRIAVDRDGQQRILSPTIARLGTDSSVIIHVDVTRDVHIEQERSRFVHMVSHHLRTPLTPLLGYAQLMGDPTLDESTRAEAGEAVEAAVLEITQLVSRLEQIASLQPVDPLSMGSHGAGRLVEEAWESLEVAHDAELRVSGSTEALVLCARNHVVEALRELFSNAVTHGRPPIDVSVTVDGDVRIGVSDAGGGIPAEWEQAIFTPFVSAEKGYIAPAARHHGLGLTLAHGLVLATRGELSYADRAFSIRLPAATT